MSPQADSFASWQDGAAPPPTVLQKGAAPGAPTDFGPEKKAAPKAVANDPFADWADAGSAEAVPQNQGSSSESGGKGQNLAAGVAEAGQQPFNLANAAANAGINSMNRFAAGIHVPAQSPLAGAAKTLGIGTAEPNPTQFSTDVGSDIARATGGWNPADVTANTTAERVARVIGQQAGLLPTMGAGGATLQRTGELFGMTPEGLVPQAGRLIRQSAGPRAIGPVAAGAAAGQVAEENVPEPYKPIANVAGNIAGAGLASGIPGAIGAGGRAVKEGVGELLGHPQVPLVGPRPTPTPGVPEGVVATEGQRDAAARAMAKQGFSAPTGPSPQETADGVVKAMMDDLERPTIHGEGTREQAGIAAQQAGNQAKEAAFAPIEKLYDTVDPDKKLTVDVSGAKANIEQTLQQGEWSDDRLQDWPGYARRPLDRVRGMPDTVRLSELRAHLTDLSAASRDVWQERGNTKGIYGALKDVQNHLWGSILGGVEQQAEGNPDIQKALDEFHGGTAGQGGSSGAGGVLPEASGAGQAAGAGPNLGAGGGGGQPGSVPGGAGVSSEVSAGQPLHQTTLNPSATQVPPEQAANLALARQQYAQQKQVFGGNVEKLLNQQSGGAAAKMLLQPETLRDYLSATNRSPESLSAVRDAVVADLRDKRIVGEDGLIDAKKLRDYYTARGDLWQHVPDLGAELNNASRAQMAYDEAMGNKKAAVDAYQRLEAGKLPGFMNSVDQMSEGQLQQLVMHARGNPDAMGGLQQMVTDYVLNNYQDPKRLQQFIQANKRPLLKLFNGGQGLQTLEAVAASIRKESASRGMVHGAGGVSGFAWGWIGEKLMELAGHAGGSVGSAAGAVGGVIAPQLLSSLRQAGIKTRNDLIREMARHADVARDMMLRVKPGGSVPPTIQRKIASRIQMSILANSAVRPDRGTQNSQSLSGASSSDKMSLEEPQR